MWSFHEKMTRTDREEGYQMLNMLAECGDEELNDCRRNALCSQSRECVRARAHTRADLLFVSIPFTHTLPLTHSHRICLLASDDGLLAAQHTRRPFGGGAPLLDFSHSHTLTGLACRRVLDSNDGV